jgi:hypothetical protein
MEKDGWTYLQDLGDLIFGQVSRQLPLALSWALARDIWRALH